MANKKITFDYGTTHYVLEFTRASVKQMEQSGFDMSRLESQPVTMLTSLFEGAFLANHKRTFANKPLLAEILKKFGNRDKLYDTLLGMYNDTVMTLFDKDEDGDGEGGEGNVTWGVSE